MAERTLPPKAELLEQYRSSLQTSAKWRAKKEKTWKACVDLYRHRSPDGKAKDGDCDSIQVNMVFATVNTILANTSIRYPKINISGITAEDYLAAMLSEVLVNQQWRHHNWQKPVRMAQKDAITIGHGWNKVTYHVEVEEYDKDDDELDAEMREILEEAQRIYSRHPDEGRTLGKKTEKAILDKLEKVGTRIFHDEPRVERVSPYSMFVDPYATCIDDARWIAQRVQMPLWEAKMRCGKDGWRLSVVDDLPTGGRVGEGDYDTSLEGSTHKNLSMDRDEDTSSDWVTLYEFYDIENGLISFFGEGGDDFVLDPDAMPFAFGHPYVFMSNYEVPDEFYPIGEIECIYDLQRELNRARSQIINDRKKYKRQYWYREGKVNDDFLTGILSDKDPIWVPIAGNDDISQLMGPIPQLPIDGQLYDVSSMILNDMDQISGVVDYHRGGSAASRTATEAAIINDGAQARHAEKLATIEQAMGEVARKALMLMQQFMTTSEIVRITNRRIELDPRGLLDRIEQRGDVIYYKANRKDISGEFDLHIEGGSTQPQNELTRAQKAMQIMNAAQVFMQVPGPDGLPMIDMEEFARYIFGELLGIKGIDKMLRQPTPGQGLPGQQGPQPVGSAPAGATAPGGIPSPTQAGAFPAPGTAPGAF